MVQREITTTLLTLGLYLTNPTYSTAQEKLIVQQKNKSEIIQVSNLENVCNLAKIEPEQTINNILHSQRKKDLFSKTIYEKTLNHTSYTLPFSNPLPLKLQKKEINYACNQLIQFRDVNWIWDLWNKEFKVEQRERIKKEIAYALILTGMDEVKFFDNEDGKKVIQGRKSNILYQSKVGAIKSLFLNCENIVNGFNFVTKLNNECKKEGVIEFCAKTLD